MNKDILLETIDFQKIYTQYEIAELLKVKHSSRIGSSLNGTESFKIPNPAGRGAKLKAYYGKGLKEAIYFGKFDWALSRNTLIVPPPPVEDFIPPISEKNNYLPFDSLITKPKINLKKSLKDYKIKSATVPNRTVGNVLRMLVNNEDTYTSQEKIAAEYKYEPNGMRCCITKLRKEVGIPIMNARGRGWKIAQGLEEWNNYLQSPGRTVDIPFLNSAIVKEWTKVGN